MNEHMANENKNDEGFVNELDARSDDGRIVKELLSLALSGAKPEMGVRQFVATRAMAVSNTRSYPRLRSLLRLRPHSHSSPGNRTRVRPATIVLVAVFISLILLNIPAVTRALASFPVVGRAYTAFLQQVSLDSAYQAGLMTRLDRTAVADGIALTVIDALAYEDRVFVSFSLSRAEDRESNDLWERIPDNSVLSVRLKVRGLFGRNLDATCFHTFNQEEDTVYGMVSAEMPRGMHRIYGLFGTGLDLSIGAYEREPIHETSFTGGPRTAGRLLTSWEISFPVQTTGVQSEVVHIGKEVTAGDDLITVDELVFTPLHTILKYTVESTLPWDALPDYVSPEDWQIPTWSVLGECFSVLTADGDPLWDTGRFPDVSPESESESGSEVSLRKGLGKVYFQATESQDLAVVFNAPVLEPETIRLPLQEGTDAPCFGGRAVLGVERVANLHGAIEVTIRLQGDGLRLKNATLVLLDEEGEGLPATPMRTFHGDNIIQSTLLVDDSFVPAYLEIRNLIAVEEPGVTVFEMEKGVP